MGCGCEKSISAVAHISTIEIQHNSIGEIHQEQVEMTKQSQNDKLIDDSESTSNSDGNSAKSAIKDPYQSDSDLQTVKKLLPLRTMDIKSMILNNNNLSNSDEILEETPRISLANQRKLSLLSNSNKYIFENYMTEGGQTQVYSGKIVGSETNVIILCSPNSLEARVDNHLYLKDIAGVCQIIDYFDGRLFKIKIDQGNIKSQFPQLIRKKMNWFCVLQNAGKVTLEIACQNQSFLYKVKLFYKILEILSQFHERNCFHLDIKPDNIMVDSNDSPVIIDLGSMQLGQQTTQFMDFLQDGHCSQVFPVERTPLFSPPTEPFVDGTRFDVYSLGCIFYQMLTQSYIEEPIKYFDHVSTKVIEKFDIPVADLLHHMLSADQFLRWNCQHLLQHSLFTGESFLCCLLRSHFLYRDLICMNIKKYFPELQRSQCFFDNFTILKGNMSVIRDDQSKISNYSVYSNCSNKFLIAAQQKDYFLLKGPHYLLQERLLDLHLEFVFYQRYLAITNNRTFSRYFSYIDLQMKNIEVQNSFKYLQQLDGVSEEPSAQQKDGYQVPNLSALKNVSGIDDLFVATDTVYQYDESESFDEEYTKFGLSFAKFDY